MTFSPTDAAFEGFRLTRREPKMIIALALLYAVFSAIILALTYYPLGQVVRLASVVSAGEQPDQSQVLAMMKAYGQIVAISALPAMVVNSIVQSAVVRSVLTPEDNRFAYLRFGKNELRVIAVNVIVSLILTAAAVLGFGIVGVLLGFAMNGMPALAVFATLLMLAVGAGLIALGVRFCLAVPMTFAQGRITIFKSISLTKGRFWPLLGMILLASVLSIVVNFLGSIVTGPLTMLSGGLTVLDGSAAISGPMVAGLFVWVAVSALLTAAQMLIFYAPAASAWKTLNA
ncbi:MULTISPECIES: hypothetical protein [unclassified Brevundimonas]|uniref:hypothetical protein n=1 Tax=unclassified Brevundimonas TaxID=2622653 RepID=UPI0025C6E9F7|nr:MULTISPECIES: hypothetical protein [unclassified Brevundimonas]